MKTPASGPKRSGFSLRNPGCLFPIFGFGGLLAIGALSIQLFTPEVFGRANMCRGSATDEPKFVNTCEYEVTTQVCLFSKAGVERDMCRTEKLAPGDGIEGLDADLARLGGLHRISAYTCKAPYLPGQVENWNTKRMEPGCLKPGQAGVGPHISRSPADNDAPDNNP